MSDYYYKKDDHAIIANGDTLTIGDAKHLKVRLEDELAELEEAIDEYNRHCPCDGDAYHEKLEQ